jgi:sulfite exporter TauE/SafE
MEDLWVAAALTFAGSAHCAGMCGAFVVAVAAGPPRQRLVRAGEHALLQIGKASSYAFLGALAGVLGAALVGSPALTWAGRVLALLAALALGAAGLSLLGLRSSTGGSGGLASLYARVTGPLLSARPTGFPLVVGLVMGLLPCPLVYAGLAAAAASGSAARGALMLAGVALGSIPALALVAVSGALVPAAWRRGLARAAGVLLLAVAALTAARGLGRGHSHAGHTAPAAGSEMPAHHHH